MTSAALALRTVSRRFSTVQALDQVDIEIHPGQVHALLGENGAGKSTAVRILAGLDTPDSGSVDVDGAPVTLRSRGEAIHRGVGLVPQADSLIDDLTLVEHLALERPQRLVRRRTAAQLASAAATADITVSLEVPVRALSRGQRQLGELAIALAQGARVLLLDEPTSALGSHETGELFTRIRALASSGVAILLITHRLAEVRAVADTATVLAHGQVVFSGAIRDVDDATLVHHMVGDLPAASSRVLRSGEGAPVLTLDQVSATCGAGQVPVRDICLQVKAGEVVGVLGVAGNGQRALAEVAAGRVPASNGTVRIDSSATGAVAYVPENRLDGLLLSMAAMWSAVVARLSEPRFARRGLINTAAVAEFSAGLFSRHDVRPHDPRVPVTALSGGNAQKLLVGRELDGRPAVAILHGPTQGLDVRAAGAIRDEIGAAADAGTAVLLVSSDLDEVRELADRIIVLSQGRIVGQTVAGRFDDAVIQRLTAGLPSVQATGGNGTAAE